MKYNITYLFLLLFAGMFSQQKDSVKAKGAEIFSIVEEMPQYPGGTAEMMKYLQTNIVYPPKERENGIEGKVFVRFIVEENGSIGETDVMKGVAGGSALDEEAMRVVKAMPNWIPGKQNGKNVRVWFNLPIHFKLSDPVETKQEKK